MSVLGWGALVGAAFPNLTSMELQGVSLQSLTFFAGFLACQNLQELVLKDVTISDDTAKQTACLPRWLPQLRQLSMDGCNCLPQLIVALAPQCTHFSFQDDDVEMEASLLEHFKHLTSVTIGTWCKQEHIEQLLACPRLQHVTLGVVDDITSDYSGVPCAWQTLCIKASIHPADLLRLPLRGLSKLRLGGLHIQVPAPSLSGSAGSSAPTAAGALGSAATAIEADEQAAAAQAAGPVEAAVRVIKDIDAHGPGCFGWYKDCMELALTATGSDPDTTAATLFSSHPFTSVASAAVKALLPLGSLASWVRLENSYTYKDGQVDIHTGAWMVAVLHNALGSTSIVQRLGVCVGHETTPDLWHGLRTCLPSVHTLVLSVTWNEKVVNPASLALFCATFPRPLVLQVQRRTSEDTTVTEVQQLLQQQQLPCLVKISEIDPGQS